MTVANRLRGAFGFYIALLAVLLVYQVRTIQHTADSEHELAAISFRLGVTRKRCGEPRCASMAI